MMVWKCAEQGCGVYWEKNALDGAARQAEKRKAKEDARGCGEGRTCTENNRVRWGQMICCGAP